MKRTNTQQIGDVLREFLKQEKLDNKIYELQLIDSWEKVLGQTVKRYSSDLYIRDKKLFVKINSAILKNDLIMSREKLIKSLNNQVGVEVITDIIFR